MTSLTRTTSLACTAPVVSPDTTSPVSPDTTSPVSSLTYELNMRNGIVVNKEDIGLIIGKGAASLKRVISGTWQMYERLQSSSKRVEEDKPKLRLVLKDHDEGITVEIISDSETMRKLAQLNMDRSVADLMKMKSKNDALKTQHFVVDCEERLLGKLIGRGGSGLKRLQNDIIYKDKKIAINKSDVETAKTARIRVEKLNVGPDDDGKSGNIVKIVQMRDTSFLGWPPIPGDDFEPHIKLTLSFKRDAKAFVDKDSYLERFSEVVMDRINQLKQEDDSQLDEINECLGF
jgi:predicted PilT family ATPase